MMKILSAVDSIFRLGADEHKPWFPEPDRSVYYMDDQDWQQHHLWDHHVESAGGAYGPYRGPTILNHPDLQYALDNGWRVHGGDKSIDHQSRGETGSGTTYLYKIDKSGLIHKAHLNVGPEDLYADEEDRIHNLGGQKFVDAYGSAPAGNWRHLIMGEGNHSEDPNSHETLRDLVDDELHRSSDSTKNGYSDFKQLNKPSNEANIDFDKKWHHTFRRAWETGTNDNHKHWDDPVPDPYAEIDKIPRGKKRDLDPGLTFGDPGDVRHPRYGSFE